MARVKKEPTIPTPDLELVKKAFQTQNLDINNPKLQAYKYYLEIKSSFGLKLPSLKQWIELQKDSHFEASRGFEVLE